MADVKYLFMVIAEEGLVPKRPFDVCVAYQEGTDQVEAYSLCHEKYPNSLIYPFEYTQKFKDHYSWWPSLPTGPEFLVEELAK